MKRFYEPLVLQDALGRTRGDHIPRSPLDDSDEPYSDEWRLRRQFIESLAFICDYKKGGTTVTAVALEETPAATVFWVVSNDGVTTEVTTFLEDMLRDLAHVNEVDATSLKETEENIFTRIVDFGKERVQAYGQFLQKPLEKCLGVIEASGNGSQEEKGRSVSPLRVV